VVDDEPSILTFVSRILKEAGYDVTTALGGALALEQLAASKPDLLLTDLMMPDMTGEQLATEARRRCGDLPVLYLTGFADRLMLERLTLRDDEAFLDKP